MFVLADVDWYSFRLSSTGKALETEEEQNNLCGLCTQAVLDLNCSYRPGLTYNAHVLYLDNYYTNRELFMELYVDDTHCICYWYCPIEQKLLPK